jgi:DNA polymerase I
VDLIFDIETNGLLDTLTTLHCLWIEDVETGERVGYGPSNAGPGGLTEGIVRLSHARRLIGHNILKFDLPAICKVYPEIARCFTPDLDTVGTKFIDTMVCTRLIWADIAKNDKAHQRHLGKLTGTHKLEAWGKRLGVLKGEYTGGWEAWNQEMHDYCGQDVAVTRELWKRITGHNTDPRALLLEHQFAFVIARMEANGFGLDEAAASNLYVKLVAERTEIAKDLAATFPPEQISEVKIAKINSPKRGWAKGQPYTKTRTVEFNPSSRQMIARRLQAKGWQPEEFTDSGQPKIDETILAELPWAEAKVLAQHFLVEKRIGQIAEGDQAWLKLVKNGVVYGSVNPNGAVTGRCTHSRPNVSQVPKVGSPLGAECRACFRPTRRGWRQVGVDLSGLELRCLAHFMAKYDHGAYGRVLLEADVHWVNAVAMGLVSGERDPADPVHKIVRGDTAKRVIYAFLYGAGDLKLGSIVNEGILQIRDAGFTASADALAKKFFGHTNAATEADLKKAGKRLKAKFLKGLPALGSLIEQVKTTAQTKGFIKGLDGRRLRVRSSHSALNTLLQSAGALIAKLATVLAYRGLHEAGYVWGRDWAFMAHVHDEVQIECRPEIADWVGKCVVTAMEEAGRQFAFRIAITGEANAGSNWAETH